MKRHQHMQPGRAGSASRTAPLDAVRRQSAGVDAVAQAGTPASPPSLETCLRPAVRAGLAEAASRLAAGRLIAIADAFEPDFAERMHRCLDGCATWRAYEGQEGDFHFRHHNLYTPREYPDDLARCADVFRSPATRSWVSGLSGRPCPGPVEFSASLYLPGDHSLPHNDVAASEGGFSRQVAYVWHLAKDWRSEWGGALYWCSKGCILPPAFNTLYLFNVGPHSSHFVTRVSPYARGKRLAINGWWTGTAIDAP